AHADSGPRRRPLSREPAEDSRHPEVHVNDEASFPEVKEMLAPRVRAQKAAAVEAARLASEPALRGGNPHDPPREVSRVVARETVDRVALGHRESGLWPPLSCTL